MMMRVEILCKKDELAKGHTVSRAIERAAQLCNIPVQITITHNFVAFANSSFNPANTPAVFINNSLEFSGNEINLGILQKKLKELNSRAGQQF